MIRLRLLLLVFAAAVAACSKVEAPEPDTPSGEPSPDLVFTFDAGTVAVDDEDPVSGVSRAAYDGTHSIWQVGDVVGLTFDADNNNLTFTQEAGSLAADGTRVRYSGSLVKALSGNIACVAYYPYSGASASGQTITTTFPATQAYRATGGYANIPLFAKYSGDYNGAHLDFKNLFSVIKLTLFRGSSLTTDAKLQQIVFKGNNNETVSGAMVVDMSGAKPTVAYTGSGKTITLDMGTGVALSTDVGTEFYIAVPAINYTKGYSFIFVTDKGAVNKKAKSAGANYAVNTIYAAPQLPLDNVTVTTSIPDGALRSALQGLGLISIFDALLDNKVSLTTTGLAATSLDLSARGIADLTGLDKLFPLLTSLHIAGNNIATADLSKLTLLSDLDISNNKLTSLTLNAGLKTLNCSGNQLVSLNVSANTLLTALDCHNNLLTALDCTKNIALLTLDCSTNKLAALDCSKNTLLTYLDCSNNLITTTLDCSKNVALITLKCYGNALDTLDISHLVLLTALYIDPNSPTSDCISGLKFTYPVGANIKRLIADAASAAVNWTAFECTGNPNILTISLQNNGLLTSVIAKNNTKLTSLNLTGHLLLTVLNVSTSGNATGFKVTGVIGL